MGCAGSCAMEGGHSAAQPQPPACTRTFPHLVISKTITPHPLEQRNPTLQTPLIIQIKAKFCPSKSLTKTSIDFAILKFPPPASALPAEQLPHLLGILGIYGYAVCQQQIISLKGCPGYENGPGCCVCTSTAAKF